MSSPAFFTTGEFGQRLIRNPAQDLKFVTKAARPMLQKAAPRQAEAQLLPRQIGAMRPSDAIRASGKLGTRIMPMLMKGLALKQGFDLANAGIRRLDDGHDWLHPRKAE